MDQDTKDRADELKAHFPKDGASARVLRLTELEAELWALPAEAIERPLEDPMDVALAKAKFDPPPEGKGSVTTRVVFNPRTGTR